ncbi:hypothetical protein ACFVH4_10020 [Nocardia ignorata]|uniref:hypothetical protein n=1 Tax=Nocardia ignorata TaxID=145285 RepID=UPI003631E6C5
MAQGNHGWPDVTVKERIDDQKRIGKWQHPKVSEPDPLVGADAEPASVASSPNLPRMACISSTVADQPRMSRAPIRAVNKPLVVRWIMKCPPLHCRSMDALEYSLVR